jgi:hypothetical protein
MGKHKNIRKHALISMPMHPRINSLQIEFHMAAPGAEPLRKKKEPCEEDGK